MYPDTTSPGADASGQSIVRSKHPGGANIALADASVRFMTDFIDAGNIRGDEVIDDQPFDETNPDTFRAWQRLNMSSDGYTVDSQ
jgi:prepilin-type processing-associated H-X9-DG protein